MTVKDYLNQAFYLDQRINSKLSILTSLREMIIKTTKILEGSAVIHTQNNNAEEDIIAKIAEMQDEIKKDIEELINRKKEIMLSIHNVNNPEYQTLLELRYICFNSWEEIADQMHCTVSNVFKVHSKALRNVVILKLDS